MAPSEAGLQVTWPLQEREVADDDLGVVIDYNLYEATRTHNLKQMYVRDSSNRLCTCSYPNACKVVVALVKKGVLDECESGKFV